MSRLNTDGFKTYLLSQIFLSALIKRKIKYLKIIGVKYIMILKNRLQTQYGWSKKKTKEVLNRLRRNNSALDVLYDGKNTTVFKLD